MRKSNKPKLRHLLEKRDFAGLRKWAGTERNAAGNLIRFLSEPDDLFRWRAIEALGQVCAAVAESNSEAVREIIRRLLWMMNDDSGNFSPHAPEAVGEILFNVPTLIEEYGRILVSFMRTEPFERAAYRAIARIAPLRPEFFSEFTEEIAVSTRSPDPAIRADAMLALKFIDMRKARGAAEKLSEDGTRVTMYDFETGEPDEITIAEIAGRILK